MEIVIVILMMMNNCLNIYYLRKYNMIQNTSEDCEAMVIYQLILQNKINFEQAVAWSKDLERRDKTAAFLLKYLIINFILKK